MKGSCWGCTADGPLQQGAAFVRDEGWLHGSPTVTWGPLVRAGGWLHGSPTVTWGPLVRADGGLHGSPSHMGTTSKGWRLVAWITYSNTGTTSKGWRLAAWITYSNMGTTGKGWRLVAWITCSGLGITLILLHFHTSIITVSMQEEAPFIFI